MRRLPSPSVLALLAVCLTSPVAAWGQDPPPRDPPVEPAPPESQPSAPAAARYDIRAELVPSVEEPERLSIRGECRSVVWENRGTEPVDTLWFRLPANAFRRSSLADVERVLVGRERPRTDDFAGLTVDQVRDARRTELPFEYVALDPRAPADRTALRVRLAEPVAPGESTTVSLRFVCRLPRLSAFGGAAPGFVLARGWYPRLADHVGLEEAPATDGWDLSATHLPTLAAAPEGAPGDADLTLVLPEDYSLVAATGSVHPDDAGEGIRLHAAGVRAFAWVAASDARRVERTARLLPDAARSLTSLPLSAFAHELEAEQRRLVERLGADAVPTTLPPLTVELHLDSDSGVAPARWFDAVEHAVGTFALVGGLPVPERVVVVQAPTEAGPFALALPGLIVATAETGEGFGFERRLLQAVGRSLTEHLATGRHRDEWLRDGVVRWIAARAAARAKWQPAVEWRGWGQRIHVAPFFEFPRLADTWKSAISLPDWATPPRIELLELWRDLPALNGATIVDRPHPLDALRAEVVSDPRPFPLTAEPWHDGGPADPRDRAARAALSLDALRHAWIVQHGPEEGRARFLGLLRDLCDPQLADASAPLLRVERLLDEDAAAAFRSLTSRTSVDYRIDRVVTLPRGVEDDGPPRTRVVLRREGGAGIPVRLEVALDAIPMRRGAADEIPWESVVWRDTERVGEPVGERAFDFVGTVHQARLVTPRIDRDAGNDSYRAASDPRPAAKWSVRFLLWLENALLSYGRFL